MSLSRRAFSFPLDKYLEVGLLGFSIGLCLTCKEIGELFSKVLVPRGVPASSVCDAHLFFFSCQDLVRLVCSLLV